MDGRGNPIPHPMGRHRTAIQSQRRLVVVTPDLLQYSQPQRIR
jgi:hypothetical protein